MQECDVLSHDGKLLQVLFTEPSLTCPSANLDHKTSKNIFKPSSHFLIDNLTKFTPLTGHQSRSPIFYAAGDKEILCKHFSQPGEISMADPRLLGLQKPASFPRQASYSL
jgi:hypothetical protein